MNHEVSSDFLGEVGQQITVTGTVRVATRVNGFTPHSPERALIVVDVGTAMVKIVTSAAWAYRVERGDQLTVAATVKAHTVWRGRRQTVLSRASHIDRIRDSTAAVPAEPWEAVNPTEAAPRPFPRTPHPLAPAPQTPTPHAYR